MKTILILSGGMDSVTLMYKLIADGDDIKCLSIDYGQRHRKELQCAKMLCDEKEIEHRIVDLSCLKPILKGSSQTDDIDVPEGHYAEENMKLTVVPNRNMIMLSIAIAWGVALKYNRVAYAAHSGDHAIYPDCRREFVDALNSAVRLCDWHDVSLYAPFLDMTKGEIVRVGVDLNVPYERTWTCYKGMERACGKCGSCTERLEAFVYAGVEDPIKYE